MAKSSEQAPTNVDSNLWANASRVYAEDSGVVDRAQGTRRKHQLAFEKMGVSASAVRARHKEREMTADERQKLYAEEQVSRRALSLWEADDPEEFERVMERASQTEPATTEEMDNLSGAHAYNDGFNGGAHGGLTVDDNKHVPGSVKHVQWARGVADGIDYAANLEGTPLVRQAHAMGDNAPPARPRGRPKKATASELLEANAAKFEVTPEPEPDPPANSLFSDMPLVPGMPN